MVRKRMLAMVTVVLLAPNTKAVRNRVHFTHAYANTNPQSLIGLPMGRHKTIVDTQGNSPWSQWSLNRCGLDFSFAPSTQTGGRPAIQVLNAGISADWIASVKHNVVQNAPLTFGGKVSFRRAYLRSGKMILTFTPPAKSVDRTARFSVGEGRSIKSATVKGKHVQTFSKSQVFLPQVAMPVRIEVEFQ